MKTIRIYRSRDPRLPDGNFGDELTVPLLDRLFGVHAVPVPMHAAELLGAGSILDAWRQSRRRYLPKAMFWGSPDLHVWGSGLMQAQLPEWPRRLRYHAVRGRLTAETIGMDLPTGDPGILANRLIDRPVAKSAAVGFVPHFVDVEAIAKGRELPGQWRLINPARPVEQVLSDIAACELIVSSSLHGLIVADSFGIPCVWLSAEGQLAGGSQFKFRDHESARSQSFNEPISYQRALGMTADELAMIATTPGRPVDDWRDELIAAFPFK